MALQAVLDACKARLARDALEIVENPANQKLLLNKQLTSPDVLSDLTYEQLRERGLSMVLAGALKDAFPTTGASTVLLANTLGESALEADVQEGIRSRPVVTQRLTTCDKVLNRAARHGFQLLKGPPRSGKTSLLQILQSHVKKGTFNQYKDALFVSVGHVPEGVTWEDWFSNQTKGQDWAQLVRVSGGGAPASRATMTLVLIDELQAIYGRRGLHAALFGYLKSLAAGNPGGVRIVAACVHGDMPGDGLLSDAAKQPTPFEYTNSHLVGLFSAADEVPSLALTPEEYADLWQATWARHPFGSGLFLPTNITRNDIFNITAGQVGMVTRLFDKLADGVPDSSHFGGIEGSGDKANMRLRRSAAIYNALKDGSRTFIQSSLRLGSPRMRLLERLLEDFTGNGCLISGLDLEEKEELQKLKFGGRLSVDDERYKFWTPLHLAYYRDLAYQGRLHGISSQDATLPDFLQLVLPRMSSQRLASTRMRSVGMVGRMLERMLQMEFYRACHDVLPAGHHADLDVGQGEGWVDFWVSPLNWAIELLRDGIDLDGHEARFEPGGKYYLMQPQAYAVVDFRRPNAAQPSRLRAVGSYHVVFDAVFGQATLIDGFTQVTMATLTLTA